MFLFAACSGPTTGVDCRKCGHIADCRRPSGPAAGDIVKVEHIMPRERGGESQQGLECETSEPSRTKMYRDLQQRYLEEERQQQSDLRAAEEELWRLQHRRSTETALPCVGDRQRRSMIGSDDQRVQEMAKSSGGGSSSSSAREHRRLESRSTEAEVEESVRWSEAGWPIETDAELPAEVRSPRSPNAWNEEDEELSVLQQSFEEVQHFHLPDMDADSEAAALPSRSRDGESCGQETSFALSSPAISESAPADGNAFRMSATSSDTSPLRPQPDVMCLRPSLEEQRRQEQARQALKEASRRDMLRNFLASIGFREVNERKQTKAGMLKASSFSSMASQTYTYPLHEAVRENKPEVVELLIWSGAHRGALDSERRTASALAKRLNKRDSHQAVIAVLEA